MMHIIIFYKKVPFGERLKHYFLFFYKRTLMNAVVFLSGVFVAQDAAGQNFHFQLEKDSSAYAELSSPTILISGQSFINKHLSVHIPFSFNFCGASTDSVIVETNGFIVLSKRMHLSLISFNNFSGNQDSVQNYPASINYTVSGSAGNQILKIEFKDLSQNMYSFYDNLSYQIWIYENGNAIEYHIGSSSYAGRTENEMQIALGAVNQQMNTEDKAFLINGSSYAPSGSIISGDNELLYLSGMPGTGTLYRLTPSN